MAVRIIVLSVCLLLGAGYVASSVGAEVVLPREPLSRFPHEIETWKGEEQPKFEATILAVLGVDEYVNRVYRAGRDRYVGFYLGYYGSQRQGDTMHSPLNCLPGAGWQPVSHRYLTIPVGGSQSISVNRYVVQKGFERHIVLYWYQSHGRAVPNEYWSKLYMVYDAVRLNRTDAALVRVVTPVIGSGAAGEEAASARAEDFVRAMFPLLEKHLPS